ncbi:CopD family protein [Microbulbifer hainanensis]|uniref:CopD family protein n=1 Tax=Microbulbifer hainanensis TaxID=2735675 RepID=UPI00186877FC|nr:CopD family protein [Microbulbifer hainanensis]
MWETAFALSKWLLYGALSAAIGGTATVQLWIPSGDVANQVKRYLLPGCIAGLLLSAIGLFIQVGAFAESGLSGMFDPVYLSILWQSPAGSVALTQSLGFVAAGLAALLLLRRQRRSAAVLWLLAATLLLLPFGWRGHTAEASPLLGPALSLHAGIAALWIGALYPLWCLNRNGEPRQIRHGMEQFGRLAAWLVALLVFCGAWILYALLGSFAPLVQSSYGLALCVKLLLVGVLLLLAAQNKWRLVPQLPATTARLSRSIRAEILLGAIILLLTALLSTLMGPE